MSKSAKICANKLVIERNVRSLWEIDLIMQKKDMGIC